MESIALASSDKDYLSKIFFKVRNISWDELNLFLFVGPVRREDSTFCS